MTTASARVLVPINVMSTMIKAGTTIAEPDIAGGEVGWISGGAYVVDDKRTSNGSVYSCLLNHSTRTVRPELDPQYWLREKPTHRAAPFDDYANTKARATGSLTFVLQPGFLNGVALYGIEGASYSVVVRDAPGGTVIAEWSGDLYVQASGLYELLFSPLPALEQLSFDGIPIAPAAEVRITISSGIDQPVAIGSIKVGDWRQFIGEGAGGTEFGADSTRKSYTFREYAKDGTYKMVRRAGSRDVRFTVVIDAAQAMYADAILGETQDVAVPIEASNLPNYAYLNTCGFIDATMRAVDAATTNLSVQIKGNI